MTVLGRTWQWTGHILRGDSGGIIKVALHWTPEDKRKRHLRAVETELKLLNAKLAKDRNKWGKLSLPFALLGAKSYDDDDDNVDGVAWDQRATGEANRAGTSLAANDDDNDDDVRDNT